MAITVRLKFDGKILIPQDPLELPTDTVLEARITVPEQEKSEKPDWRAALDRIMARGVHGAHIPDEALSRENIYPDRV